MPRSSSYPRSRHLRPWIAVLALLSAACEEGAVPSSPEPLESETPAPPAIPAETPVAPPDAPAPADVVLDKRSDSPGVVFGTFNIRFEDFSSEDQPISLFAGATWSKWNIDLSGRLGWSKLDEGDSFGLGLFAAYRL